MQAIWATFSRVHSPLPACIAGAAGAAFLGLDKSSRLPAALRGHWASVPGWTATLLFAFQPLAQAVSSTSQYLPHLLALPQGSFFVVEGPFRCAGPCQGVKRHLSLAVTLQASWTLAWSRPAVRSSMLAKPGILSKRHEGTMPAKGAWVW